MKANICSQCGAPLDDSTCEFCGTQYDIEYEESYGEPNFTGNVSNISDGFESVIDMMAIVPIIFVLSIPIVVYGWIKDKFSGRCVND